jgi:hypothetical protein
MSRKNGETWGTQQPAKTILKRDRLGTAERHD